ncbi:MFS transporter [Streptomyces sp. cg40]|uniref:MFS transporter n=1 Tax=Streptomyces sp. cg40 TaxID=3419764 RepID=UPI003D06E2D3
MSMLKGADRSTWSAYLPSIQLVAFVEWTGTGLFLAVSTIYFIQVVGLSAAAVGAGLSIAGALAMPSAVLVARLAERFGPRRVLVGVDLLRSIATLSYLWVDGWPSFLCVTVAIAVAEQSSPPLVQAYVGAQTTEDLRSRVMAVQRTIVNVGISVGGLIAGVVLGTADRGTFHWLLLGGASAYAAVALLLLVMGGDRTAPRARRSITPLLKDRRLLNLTLYNAVLSLWTPMLNIAFPLWLVTHTDVPERFVGILYTVNTVACIALQYPLNRCYRTTRSSWSAYGAAGGLLAVSCVGFAAAPGFGVRGAVSVMACAVVVLTFAEVLQVGASWTLSYELAPEDARSSYLVLFNLGRTTANRVAGPLLMTGVVIALGTAGWMVLAVLFVLASIVPVFVLRAQHRVESSVLQPGG